VQHEGIAFTLVFALVTGAVAGKLISLTGSKKLAYEDADEFVM
jgi:ammonium transporter Rh